MTRAISISVVLALTFALGACASDSLLTGTGATSALPAQPKADPACKALASQIEDLSKDGLIERTEAASKGKGSTVSVKRASLGQLAQLEKVNAEFRAKCSTTPLPTTASAVPGKAVAKVAAVKPADAGAEKAAIAPKN